MPLSDGAWVWLSDLWRRLPALLSFLLLSSSPAFVLLWARDAGQLAVPLIPPGRLALALLGRAFGLRLICAAVAGRTSCLRLGVFSLEATGGSGARLSRGRLLPQPLLP